MTVTTTKGNPNTDPDVGSEVTIQFNGSAIRYAVNKITGYEVYRSTTNYGTEELWTTNATKVKTFTGLNFSGYEGDITYDATRTYVDTVTTDATDYYYRVRAIGTNSDGAVTSSLSSIQTGTLHYGWDTTPDTTAPALPAEVKVKDIHDDGLNYKRNIITWARIADSQRTESGTPVDDFKEYKIYRSNDGLTWSQICTTGTNTILLANCTTQYPNPLYNANRELGFANNYFMDLIPIAQSNQFYYYHVTAIDDAGTQFKYPNGTVINPTYNNESEPDLDSEGHISAVSLNPYIAKPTITTDNGGKKAILEDIGVSTAVIAWTTDQPADSLIEFRPVGSTKKYKAIGDREMLVNHSVDLFGLSPNTTYDYRIISRNSLANDVIASGSDLPTLTTTGFNITPGGVSTTTSTSEINWTTNLDASSAFVEYQLQKQVGDEAQSGTAGVSADLLLADISSNKKTSKYSENRASPRIKSFNTRRSSLSSFCTPLINILYLFILAS